jgi:hypothetical protein
LSKISVILAAIKQLHNNYGQSKYRNHRQSLRRYSNPKALPVKAAFGTEFLEAFSRPLLRVSQIETQDVGDIRNQFIL